MADRGRVVGGERRQGRRDYLTPAQVPKYPPIQSLVPPPVISRPPTVLVFRQSVSDVCAVWLKCGLLLIFIIIRI